jgi:hypothetical protein
MYSYDTSLGQQSHSNSFAPIIIHQEKNYSSKSLDPSVTGYNVNKEKTTALEIQLDHDLTELSLV